MKIYYYSGATLPSDAAKSVHVMKMCQALGRSGHDVTLFARGAGSEIKAIYDYYGVTDCFKIEPSPDIRIPLIGGAVRLFNIWRRKRALGGADIYYGRDPIALALFSDANGRISYEAHQMAYLLTHRFVTRFLQKLGHFTGFVCISEALKRDFLSEYGDLAPEKVLVAHDGADIAVKIDVSGALLGRDHVFKAGYAGSLHGGKGAEIIMNAAQAAKDIDFHVFGGKPEQILALKEAYPSVQNVYFYGHRPHSELSGYLAQMDVLLAPYQREARIKTGQDIARWISPMKLFEYMAVEKPIMCSDLAVIKEILRDGENAVLLSPDDVQAWVSALYKMRDDPMFGRALSAQAHDDLVRSYSWDVRARNVAEFCST